jgi:hypothetical protein
MKQSEKLARMAMFVSRIEVTARNINEEGNDYDMSWHRKYVANLVDIAKEMRDILKKK